MLKDTNYVVIPAWAINHFDLNPTELIIYSVIYGFSQDGSSKFSGSATYLSEITHTTRQTVMNALKHLCEKGLITKKEHFVNGVAMPMYENAVDDSQFLQGVKNFDRGCQENEHHNTSNSTSTSTTEDKEKRPQSECGKALEDKGVVELKDTTTEIVPKRNKKVKPEPPTEEMCVQYALEKNLVIDPYFFFAWFNDPNRNWVNKSGRNIAGDWKRTMCGWNTSAVSRGDRPWDGKKRVKNHVTSTDNEQLKDIEKASEKENSNGIF